ncbi:hypothetical protein [Haloferula rosea]|uniref:Serine protease n=1 Tax=Haloferula rosea TaxID=490093 RepID=A0A934RFK7_9BACT|nr:hypothetical protein [Haloferula rosea]MBK1827475.1 hypothetical protein [Haloferula rosea]
MFRIASLLAFTLISCSSGGDAGAPHHPDLRLWQVAQGAEGSSDLFKNYRVDGPVLWNQGWPWKLDLTGVAWDRSNTATAITPRHVVMASHYIRKQGEPLVYHDRKGNRHVRRVEKVIHFKERKFSGDVAIGLLDQPLPASVRTYPLPAPRADGGEALIGATALITEQKRKLYFHQIGRISNTTIGFRSDRRNPESRQKKLIAGDSGHPSFILSKGELVLIETHTGGGAGSGPFYGAKAVQDCLSTIINELDPAYRFRTVNVDDITLNDAKLGRKQFVKAPSRPQNPTRPADTPQQPAQPGEPRRPRPRVVVPPPRPKTKD